MNSMKRHNLNQTSFLTTVLKLNLLRITLLNLKNTNVYGLQSRERQDRLFSREIIAVQHHVELDNLLQLRAIEQKELVS